MIENGFYRLSNEEYHSGPGVSKSDMKELLRSPAHWKSPDPPDTEAMAFGAAMHPGILEPDRFKKEYCIYPEDCLIGSGKGQQGRKAEFDEKCSEEGRTTIKPEWMDQIIAMRDAVQLHPTVKELRLLEDGESELSGFYSDPEFENVLTKVRPDYLNKVNHLLSDLKSTTDARSHKFQSIAFDKGYDIQAGHYLYTVSKLTKILHNEFYFIAVERPKVKGQYVGVMVYRADDDMITNGLLLRSRALTIYNECVKTGCWPGYPAELQILGPPAWMKRKEGMNPIFD